MNYKETKGITLIALIITIIILLILAGITINLTVGQRGILTRAQEAGRNYQEAAKKEDEDFTRFIGKDIKGLKIAVPNFFMSDIVNIEIINKVKDTIKVLENNGAKVDYVDIKYIDKAMTLYQIIAMGEASSNLARFDGIRYGHSKENPENIEDVYYGTRAEGFGEEVKRRIILVLMKD